MANPVCEVLLTDAQLKAPQDDLDLSVGAVVDFWGIVRTAEDGGEIDGIKYETHQAMAEHQLSRIAQQTIEKFKIELIVIHHRTGFIAAGEASLFIRVASRHRAEGFQASQWAVDELKRKVPIWKRPKFKIDKERTTGRKRHREIEADLIPRV